MEPQAKSNVFWTYPSSPDVSLNFVFSVSGFVDNNNKNKKLRKSRFFPFKLLDPLPPMMS